jgi:GTP-binding protein
VSAKQGQEPWRIVEASFSAGAQALDQLPAQLTVEVAFAGRSNVGKSSLMNTLMDRRRLVRTSSTPGCTRAINFFDVRARDDARFRLVDLPGYGYAKRSKSEKKLWAELIETYLSQRDWLKAVVLLVDARRGFGEVDAQLRDFVMSRDEKNRPMLIVVATKIDKIAKSKRKSALAKLNAGKVKLLGASAETGEGVEELWRLLRKATHVGPSAMDQSAVDQSAVDQSAVD